jgi:hypothetical protein
MSESISIDDFPPHVRERLKQAVRDAATITLTDQDRPVAEFRPLAMSLKVKQLADVLRSLPRLAPDDADVFSRDVAAARRAIGPLPSNDPWES